LPRADAGAAPADPPGGQAGVPGERAAWAAARPGAGRAVVARPRRGPAAGPAPAGRPRGAAFAASALAAGGLGFLAIAGDPAARAAALGIPPLLLVGLIVVAALGSAAALALLAPWPAQRRRPKTQRWLAFALALVLAVPLSGLAALFVDASAQVDGSYCAGCAAVGLGGVLGGLALAWGATAGRGG